MLIALKPPLLSIYTNINATVKAVRASSKSKLQGHPFALPFTTGSVRA